MASSRTNSMRTRSRRRSAAMASSGHQALREHRPGTSLDPSTNSGNVVRWISAATGRARSLSPCSAPRSGGGSPRARPARRRGAAAAPRPRARPAGRRARRRAGSAAPGVAVAQRRRHCSGQPARDVGLGPVQARTPSASGSSARSPGEIVAPGARSHPGFRKPDELGWPGPRRSWRAARSGRPADVLLRGPTHGSRAGRWSADPRGLQHWGRGSAAPRRRRSRWICSTKALITKPVPLVAVVVGEGGSAAGSHGLLERRPRLIGGNPPSAWLVPARCLQGGQRAPCVAAAASRRRRRRASSSKVRTALPEPAPASVSARSTSSGRSAASSSACRSSSRPREISGDTIEKDGFSVVAATSVTCRGFIRGEQRSPAVFFEKRRGSCR